MKTLGVAALAAALVLGAGAAADAAGAAAPSDAWLDAPVPLQIAAVFERPTSDWGPGHRGIDLLAAEGADVHSPGAGVVTFAGDVAGRGVVVVLHPSGLRSTLEPVTASVTVGTQVGAGDVVGALERTGSHCGARTCLHWGVRRGNEYLDPLDVLRGYGPIRLLPLRE